MKRQTSESLFGISEQPGEICPLIDAGVAEDTRDAVVALRLWGQEWKGRCLADAETVERAREENQAIAVCLAKIFSKLFKEGEIVLSVAEDILEKEEGVSEYLDDLGLWG